MGLLDRLRLSSRSTARAMQPVDVSWLQRHTLGRGFDQEVVGEASYQAALAAVSGGAGYNGARRPWVTAQLVRDAGNRHDRNAVAVFVAHHLVGYIPREQAPAWHKVIAELNAMGKPATCLAQVTGGWDRGPRDRGSFGICLDAEPAIAPTDAPVLPSGANVAVTGEEHHQNELRQLCGDRPPREVLAHLGGAGDRRLGVWIAGTQVGLLTDAMSERYMGLARAVHAAGLPVSCSAVIERGQKKLEVRLRLPNADMAHQLEQCSSPAGIEPAV